MATTADDLRACQRLRHACFFGRPGLDSDAFDAACQHVMVRDENGDATGNGDRLVGTCRVMIMTDGAALTRSYAALAYDPAPLAHYTRPVMEVGRFCVAPDAAASDVLRLTWGVLTGLVDAHGIGLLTGCSSFAGADPDRHAAALALLADRHRGPVSLRPFVRDVPHLRLDDLAGRRGDRRRAVAGLPPLLRSYLGLGGWVGDHAVIDAAMDTLHVFTALSVDAVPAARARALRALSGG